MYGSVKQLNIFFLSIFALYTLHYHLLNTKPCYSCTPQNSNHTFSFYLSHESFSLYTKHSCSTLYIIKSFHYFLLCICDMYMKHM